MEEIKNDLVLKEDRKSIKNLTAKIVLIVLAIIGLSLTTLSFIKVNLKVNLHQDQIESITLYKNAKSSSEIWGDQHEEIFNELLNMFNSTFSKQSVAYALFSGKVFANEKIGAETKTNAISNLTKSTSSGTYILFSYKTEQQIMLNNKPYTSDELSKQSKLFTKVLVEINNEVNMKNAKIYYVNENGYSYFYSTVASTGREIYEYINNFF